MDVGGWLRGLGLDQYEENFRDNKIDADVLPQLTADDLKEIGVSAVGDRRRLLAAIVALAPAPVTQSEAGERPSWAERGGDPTQRGGGGAGSARDFAERRLITVMFCDLVGSTSLASQLDAEDWRNLVGAYLDAAEAAVTAFGGHVLKRLGDGLMALFGYPQAQENDAERAVRAALAVQRALSEINARNAGKDAPELSARVGLESGPVVIDATGEVFGEAPNVAARVQAAAEPGTVLVTASVQRHIAGLFVAEDRGAHELKGVPAPVALYRIVRASGGGRRSRARAPVPLVGRAEELDLLMRRWERAQSGQGQFVQIVGEPGIGKSRLLEEFHARLAETPHTWVEFSSSQLLQNTPLHPFAEWGRQRFGDVDTPAAQRFADLENTLQLIGLDPAEHAPLVAPLVDIPPPPGRAVDLPPEELRRRQLAALIAWFLAGARSQPVAIAFEDLHWADPTSLDLMKALAERGAQAPLLILATTRPEFRAPWSLRAHHSVISLTPLARADVARNGRPARRAPCAEQGGGRRRERAHRRRAAVRRGGDAPPARARRGRRPPGDPTYFAAVARGAARPARTGPRGGADRRGARARFLLRAARRPRSAGSPKRRNLHRAQGAVPLPASRGRIRRRHALSSPLAGEGTVEAWWGVAPTFPATRATAPTPPSNPRSIDSPKRICCSSRAPAPQATYRFKHALIQDAAYDSLLKSRRQALHRRAAEILRDDPERAAAEPEVIAHHFTEAGLDDLAIEWWGKAGDQALRRSAFQEAIAHLGKAIAMADKVGQGGSPIQRLKLQTSYGQAWMFSKGFSAEEARTAFTRAQQLAAGVENAGERFRHLLWAVGS